MSQFLSEKQAFYKLFYATAKHQNPQETFADFIKTSAIAIHNGTAFCEAREQRYFSIIEKYSDNDVQNMCHMLSHLVMMLDEKPVDALGEIMSELGLTFSNVRLMSLSQTLRLVLEVCYWLLLESLLNGATIPLTRFSVKLLTLMRSWHCVRSYSSVCGTFRAMLLLVTRFLWNIANTGSHQRFICSGGKTSFACVEWLMQ